MFNRPLGHLSADYHRCVVSQSDFLWTRCCVFDFCGVQAELTIIVWTVL